MKLDGWSICKVRNTGVRTQKECVLPKFRQSLMPRETTEGDFGFTVWMVCQEAEMRLRSCAST